jgi:cbb3-type cytochrome oxidase subunit 3
MDDLVQEMATMEFWIELAFVIVFGGGWFACYRAATKAERAETNAGPQFSVSPASPS